MDQRISLVTLGVRDLDRAQRLAQAATARRQSVEAQRSADIAQIRAAGGEDASGDEQGSEKRVHVEWGVETQQG